MQAADVRIAGGIVDAVHKLLRILLQVIELILGQKIDAELVAPVKRGAQRLKRTKGIMVDLIATKLNEAIVVDTPDLAARLRHQALSRKNGGTLEAEQLKNGRGHVGMGDRLLAHGT